MDCSGLTSVTIPSSVHSIGARAFSGCEGLTTVYYNADSCSSNYYGWSNWFYEDTNITSFVIGEGVRYIPEFFCVSLSGLTSITIPSSVSSIGRFAFEYCTNLTTVNFNAINCNNSMVYIFNGDTNITSFIIGDSVRTIPTQLCVNMKGLTTLEIPRSVTNINYGAFSYCTALTTVLFNADSCVVNYSLFENDTNI